MPADRGLAEGIGANLISLYADAEAQLVAEMARRLAAGMDRPDWAGEKLAAIGDLRRHTEQLLADLADQTTEQAAAAVLTATQRGQYAAWRELETVAAGNPRLAAMLDAGRAAARAARALPGAGAVAQLAASLSDRLINAHTPVLRWVVDAYREVIGRGAAVEIALGLSTRRRASERAWQRLLGEGITGFVDRAGRRWNLASYVEMATRTSVAQAAIEAHGEQLAELGVDLLVVSNAPQECKKCRPWEGKVISRSGPPGERDIQVEHATEDGRMVRVAVAGSFDEASAAGLFHPQCRHSTSAYLPGITKPPTNTADPQGDAARQRLRTLERRLRRAKIQEAGALTPEAAAVAKARVRDLQGQIRQHVADTQHLGIVRRYDREQINLGNRPGRPPGLTQPAPQSPRPGPGPAPAAKPKPEPKPPAHPAPIADDGLDALDEAALQRLAVDYDVPDHANLDRAQLLAGLRERAVVSPARMRELTPDEAARVAQAQQEAYHRLSAAQKAKAVARQAERDALADEQFPPGQYRNSRARPLKEVLDLEPDEAELEFARGIDGWYGDIRAAVTPGTVDRGFLGELTVDGLLFDRAGNQVGQFTRWASQRPHGRREAHHDYLSLDPSVQGSGFANEFNQNLFDWYRRSGFDMVTTTANVDVGGYTWATQGFDFAATDAASKIWGRWLDQAAKGRPNARARIASMGEEYQRQVDRFRAEILPRLDAGEHVSAYELSQFGRRPGQGKADWWLGKAIMMGSTWEGILPLR